MRIAVVFLSSLYVNPFFFVIKVTFICLSFCVTVGVFEIKIRLRSFLTTRFWESGSSPFPKTYKRCASFLKFNLSTVEYQSVCIGTMAMTIVRMFLRFSNWLDQGCNKREEVYHF